MKICIFSDIHGNNIAFDKMYNAERFNVDLFIFAGDIFGYFYDQQEIVERFMKEDRMLAIKGNHDRDYLLYKNNEDRKKHLVNKYGSSYNITLSKMQEKYIYTLPEYMEKELDGKKIGIFHGWVDGHLDQRIYPDTQINLNVEYDYIILGHTHYRYIIRKENTMIINPGSLGQPRDNNGFSYCILNTDNGTCSFKTVEINVDSLISEVKKKDSENYVYHYLKNKYGR